MLRFSGIRLIWEGTCRSHTVEEAVGRFGARSTQIGPILIKIVRKTIFTLSSPVTLTFDLWTSNLLVTRVQRYVFTELKVSTAFHFRENRKHRRDGRTDGRTDRRMGCNT